MRTSQITAFIAGCGLASASVSLLKRWDYDMCDCSLSGLPLPDSDNFQLPLEDLYQERCPPTYLGDLASPIATSQVCLDFIGPYLYFNVSAFPGYTTKWATVSWRLKGNMLDEAGWSSPKPTSPIDCKPAPNGLFVCRLPFSEILDEYPTASIKDIMSGMCPNGDREGLILYLEFFGEVLSNTHVTIPFQNKPPCETRTDRVCTAWQEGCDYIEVSYRCSKCDHEVCPPDDECPLPSSTTSASTTSTPTESPTPTSSTESTTATESSSTTSSDSPVTTSTESSSTTSTDTPTTTQPESSTTSSSTTSTAPSVTPTACGSETAFGYMNAEDSIEFSGRTCNRWGWYHTPTLAELQSSIGGVLYGGAGGGIDSAALVGSWTATANAAGLVTVIYTTTGGWTMDEVHVELKCTPISCNPGGYTYKAENLNDATSHTTLPPLRYPTCTRGSRAALILHAAVNRSCAT